MPRTLDEFLKDMTPFSQLFNYRTELENYYGAMAARMYRIAGNYVRIPIRKMGYEPISRMINSTEVQKLETILGEDHAGLLDMESICRMIPSDFVIDLRGGFFGSQLLGAYDVADLVETNPDGGITIKNRKTIFRDILTEFVIPHPRNRLGESGAFREMEEEFSRLRLRRDATSLYKMCVIDSFIKACGKNVPSDIATLHAKHDHLRNETEMKVILAAQRMIVRDGSLVSEHVLGNFQDLTHISAFFDRLGAAGKGLTEFASKFRLDKDFPNPTSKYAANAEPA